jgi:hypothetical protein
MIRSFGVFRLIWDNQGEVDFAYSIQMPTTWTLARVTGGRTPMNSELTEEVLAAISEVVVILRTLAQARPAIIRDDFVTALKDFAATLIALGRNAEAETATAEAEAT